MRTEPGRDLKARSWPKTKWVRKCLSKCLSNRQRCSEAIRTEPGRDLKARSWPNTVLRKWLNIKTDDFNSDSAHSKGVAVGSGVQVRRKSCSDHDPSGGWLEQGSEGLKLPRSGSDTIAAAAAAEDMRMLVGTWNVGGRSPRPHDALELRDWLTGAQPDSKPSADIYVLGFQEIVPLNAGNVLGAEDAGPARTWLSLVRQALNPQSGATRRKSSAVGPTPLPDSDCLPPISFSDLLSIDDRDPASGDESREELVPFSGGGGYSLVASKQMVGVFLCVWVRAELVRHVSRVKVSCVGRGIMGYMGNKGSVSISMTMRRTTTLCFVCTHLTSGEKDGDDLRRNSDVAEILKRTRFPQSPRRHLSSPSPDTILEHDMIVWLGDLNYRLADSGDTIRLLQKRDWEALLEKDQLLVEKRIGGVFEGWEEGEIHFPPTYKYNPNSDRYAIIQAKSKEKRRTPAWCDRILWRGKGMKQMWYARGESRFSDHRPVYSLFSLQLDDYDQSTAVVERSCCYRGPDSDHVATPHTLLTTPRETKSRSESMIWCGQSGRLLTNGNRSWPQLQFRKLAHSMAACCGLIPSINHWGGTVSALICILICYRRVIVYSFV